jgi:hypothetical protein
MTSPVDTALAATSFILDRKLVLVEGGATGGHGDGSSITVTADELPVDPQSMTMNFHLLFRKCSKKELDLQRYCIACFCRSLQRCQPGWLPELWRGLAEAAREVCTSCALQDLVEEFACGVHGEVVGMESRWRPCSPRDAGRSGPEQ